MNDLQTLLEESASRHSHLCPRQVLGVRMGLAGLARLGLEPPGTDKQLLVVVESDGCFVDGVEVSTGCCLGKRTLRVEDYGKVAATFVDIKTGRALRLAPRVEIRERARLYAPQEEHRYYAQLHGYKWMPADELFDMREVILVNGVKEIISQPGVRTYCQICAEEIINEREVIRAGMILCYSCAGPGYYQEVLSCQPELLLQFTSTYQQNL